jgi:predicted RNase H-like nuclease (RuvC/YqgF family)
LTNGGVIINKNMTTLKTAKLQLEKLKEENDNLKEIINKLEKELDSFRKNMYIVSKNKLPS